MHRKTAVILVNTGTPDNISVGAVRRYLMEFLMDGRVISLPALWRYILVKGIIVPFRAPRSARLYQKIWTAEGSPLLVLSEQFTKRLQSALGDDYQVFLGMRYGNPNLVDVLSSIKAQQFSRLVVVPLFPQYASSTIGSVVEKTMQTLRGWENMPELSITGPFYDKDGFLNSWVERIKSYEPHSFDHVIFSYHGLPLRHVEASHKGMPCDLFGCTTHVNNHNVFCYQAACYATTRGIAQRLNLAEGQFTIGFQSRFSKAWLAPFTDVIIKEKASSGVKKLLIVSPSFVTDCLETIMEIGIEYRELFMEHGGASFQWVPSLNTEDSWISFLKKHITDGR